MNSKESNFRASLIKRDALTVAVEGDGLLLSTDELPKIAHPSLITSSIDFYVHLRRMSFKVNHFKDKDVVMYIDGLKITPKVFYGNALNVYYGNMKPVTTLYTNPHMKWSDAGLCRVAHSDIISGKICGGCMELVEGEFVIVLDSIMMNIFGSPAFSTEKSGVDIKSMMGIDEIMGKMDVITSKDISDQSNLSEEGVINRLDELNIEDDYMLDMGKGEEHEFPFRDAIQCIRFRDCSVKFKAPELAILHFEGIQYAS